MSGAATPSVLVVDDDRGILDALRRALELDGFVVRQASTGIAALAELERSAPDVIVQDVGLPDVSGIEVIRTVRAGGHSTPICVLSARDEITDRVAGLAAGADDYVVKPFSVTELAARLHALIGAHRARRTQAFAVGDLEFRPLERTASRAGRDLALTGREYELLDAFSRHPAQVLTRDQLLELVWGYTWEIDSNVVDVFVGYLRRKTEAAGEPRLIHTVRGLGFVLRPHGDAA